MQVTENTPQAQEAKKPSAREMLKERTSAAKLLVEAGEQPTVNAALLAIYKQRDFLPQDTTFMLFGQWKAKGFRIKKGSKGYPVWGAKREAATEDGEAYEYFPVAYLFSQFQVELSNPQPRPARA